MVGYPVVDRVDEILRLASGRRVLHLGCTAWPYTEAVLRDGALLHARLHGVAEELVGIDADRDGIDALERLGLGPVVLGDAEDLEAIAGHELLRDGFDLIVAAEIIEHLSNPGRLLEGMVDLLAPGGRLVVTTINAYGAVRIVPYALRGRGGEQEPVHPDHVAYYSPSTLRLIVQRHGYEVETISFYGLAPEHRRHASRWITLANDVATRFSRQLADGLVLTATRDRGAEPGR
jgi:SAM-dependent methyltransferase